MNCVRMGCGLVNEINMHVIFRKMSLRSLQLRGDALVGRRQTTGLLKVLKMTCQSGSFPPVTVLRVQGSLLRC